MRSLSVALIVIALCLSSVVSAVTVPYKSCAGAHDDANLTSIETTRWPPVKGAELALNITGNNSKIITSGTYTINIRVNGIPLPDIDGNIADFKPLPWPEGELNFTYTQEIPSIAPSGQYAIKISAVDQDKDEIFCITLSFTISMSEAEEAEQRHTKALAMAQHKAREEHAAAASPPAPAATEVDLVQERVEDFVSVRTGFQSAKRVPRMNPMPRMRRHGGA